MRLPSGDQYPSPARLPSTVSRRVRARKSRSWYEAGAACSRTSANEQMRASDIDHLSANERGRLSRGGNNRVTYRCVRLFMTLMDTSVQIAMIAAMERDILITVCRA